MSGEGEMFTQGSEQKPVDEGGIAQRVKEVRKWAGLTQEEFAKRIGYSKNTGSFCRKGKGDSLKPIS